MRIKLTSILVNDQEKALKFYTEKLDFIKKADLLLGEFRWLTIVSPEGPNDLELSLEPNLNEVAKAYQVGLFTQGIPINSFEVDDVQEEFQRLINLGINFTMEPQEMGNEIMAVFNDTCGNLIQIYQIK